MALLHRRALPWVLTVRGWTGKPQGGLWVAVVIWWLLVFGIIAIMITTTEPVGEADAVSYTPGQDAHLFAGHLASWLIPIDHATFDDSQGRVLAGHEHIVADTLSRPGWIRVAEGQAIRVIVVVGDAVQIELLESPGTGDRGWIHTVYLRP
jgi:hypothetical protein